MHLVKIILHRSLLDRSTEHLVGRQQKWQLWQDRVLPGGTLDHVCQLFVCQWMADVVQYSLLTSVIISSSLCGPVAAKTQ